MEAYYSKFNLTHFHIDIQVNQDTLFFSDDSKIRVILNNLFSNSVQFQKHEPGPKHISLTIDVVDTAAIITLEDNGIGIEKKHHPEVFNLFMRATQKNVGTGLGLYMVKEAVEQMGGRIDLESELNEGTTVRVTLPSMK
jgi:signal transduction histidine kinase